MGEESWRVEAVGLLSLDNLAALPLLSLAELEKRCGLALDPAPLLVTYHPETLDYQHAEAHADELLAALAGIKRPIVFTAPNADTSGRAVGARIRDFVSDNPNAVLVEHLGTQAYFSMMRIAAAMIGNSSSGLLEAPSFELPVVNVGTRQDGRVRAVNVIDSGAGRAEIAAALQQVLLPEFRDSLRGLANPYGDGHTAERIAGRLRTVALDRTLIRKRFIDHAPEPALSFS
jgi:UDP-hydrolysing UDP-N-acetyl-D-glucosamine 2-epimerase